MQTVIVSMITDLAWWGYILGSGLSLFLAVFYLWWIRKAISVNADLSTIWQAVDILFWSLFFSKVIGLYARTMRHIDYDAYLSILKSPLWDVREWILVGALSLMTFMMTRRAFWIRPKKNQCHG